MNTPRRLDSRSTVHFGHYKVAASVDIACPPFSLRRLVLWHGPEARQAGRWGCGLNVLLEKIAGVALVHKLRAILLMEADFNMHNRFRRSNDGDC
jgi:hypothetical protein